MKTLLDISKSAHVSKVTVWRYVKKHNVETKMSNGVLYLDDKIANDLIAVFDARNLKGEMLSETDEIVTEIDEMFHETDETLRETDETLRETLSEMEYELLSVLKSENQFLRSQVEKLTTLLDQEQQLHARVKQEHILLLESSKEKKTFLQRFFRNKF